MSLLVLWMMVNNLYTELKYCTTLPAALSTGMDFRHPDLWDNFVRNLCTYFAPMPQIDNVIGSRSVL